MPRQKQCVRLFGVKFDADSGKRYVIGVEASSSTDAERIVKKTIGNGRVVGTTKPLSKRCR